MKKFAYVTLVFVCSVHALAVPQLISYQGSLTDSTGTPLDTTVSITFTIYDASSGGMNLWTETHPSVVIENGLFQVLLGSVTALSELFSANRWLGITVGGDTEMSPRQQIVSVAHAYRVGTVAGASGGSISGNVTITGKATIGNGHVNSGTRAFVAGSNNKATGDYSVISGGGGAAADSNSASGINSVIGGGLRNQASAYAATVGGGELNAAPGPWATVSGGGGNITDSGYATIAGGWDNSVSHFAGVVSGGVHNFARGAFSTVAGGGGTAADSNVAGGDYSVIGGGAGNDASGFSSTIAGGARNIASGSRATVGGGRSNRARGDYSVVAGGGGASLIDSNSANGAYSFIGGGRINHVSASNSAIIGGFGNTVYGTYSTVGGGFSNTASGVGGIIAGGNNNTTGGQYASVLGGGGNRAVGDYSCAFGLSAYANHIGAFVWGSGTLDTTASFNPATFTVRSPGGARFYTAQTGTATGVQLMAGGGAWSNLSDVRQKENFRDADSRDVLDKISQLKISEWNYKSQDDNIRHMGPMAQDFYTQFGLGESDTTITTIDPDGVLFAAVQELNKRNEQLQTTNQDLQNQINQLRSLVQTIAAERQQSSKR